MLSNDQYDLAVIGGGLAGLALAISCSKQGSKVILFEKETYPFHKVCGEYISRESWDFLSSLGIPLAQLKLPMISRFETTDISGKQYEFPLDLGGFGISRFFLDNLLAKLATSHNVQIRTGVRVTDVAFQANGFTLVTHDQTYKARVVAGSFGKRSNLDLKLNRGFVQTKPSALNNYIGVKYHIRYPQPPDLISLHNFQNGYCGISRIEDRACCLCYMTTAQNLRNSGNSIFAMEQKVLGRNPALEKIFKNAEFLYPEPLTISAISFEKKSQVENHILMLGDAAGMIPPLCGNGMSMALHSSKIASKLILQFVAGQLTRAEMERQYEVSWKTTFSKRLLTGRLVQRLFGGTTSTMIFLQFMKSVPPLARKVISLTHGKPF